MNKPKIFSNKLQRDSFYEGWNEKHQVSKGDALYYKPNYIILHLHLFDNDNGEIGVCRDFCDTVAELQDAYQKNYGKIWNIHTTLTHFFSWRYADELVLHYGDVEPLRIKIGDCVGGRGREIKEYHNMEHLLLGGEWEDLIGDIWE